MKFLMIYGTTEGQTRKISEFIAIKLVEAGHEVDVRNSVRRLHDLDVSSYDAAIIAGSVHQRNHQESIANFVIAHRKQLEKLPTLFISVSLSIVFDGSAGEAIDYLEHFIDHTGFRPTKSLLVAGALRFDEYDYFMEQIIEFVVLKDQEKIIKDEEFTDWNKLEKDVSAFVGTISERG